MIDLFRAWLPQIVGYAEAIQDGTLQRAWSKEGPSKSSAYYSGELYEQVFGDLDSDNKLQEAQAALGSHPPVAEALEHFLASLKRLDVWIEAHVETSEWGKGQTTSRTVADIFKADEWQEAQSAGVTLSTAAEEAGFSSKDPGTTA